MPCADVQDTTNWCGHQLHQRNSSLQTALPNSNTAVGEHVHAQECWQGIGTVPGFVEVHCGIHLGGYTRKAGPGLVDILLELLHWEKNLNHGEEVMVGSHHLGEGEICQEHT